MMPSTVPLANWERAILMTELIRLVTPLLMLCRQIRGALAIDVADRHEPEASHSYQCRGDTPAGNVAGTNQQPSDIGHFAIPFLGSRFSRRRSHDRAVYSLRGAL